MSDDNPLMTPDERIERAIQRVSQSKQVAFGGDGGSTIGDYDFAEIMRWADSTPPDYGADLREYDRWHYDFLMNEPHLRGVLGQATSIIRNRGYTFVGGRINVNRSKGILDGANRKAGAPFGAGYRQFITKLATAFYFASFGAPVELGRDEAPRFVAGEERYGPLRSVWSGDPTLFRVRTRETKQHPIEQFPYAYYGGSRVSYWRHSDMIRMVDNPAAIDAYGDVGLSAVAICRELAEILVAVYRHDKEKLGARAPKGLLLLQNISPDMWNIAMNKRSAQLSAYEREYYGGVGVLARSGVDQIDAKLVALSTIPDGFDRRETIDLLMYLYALVFKFSPDEFWPVQGGSFGRGEEARLGIERSTRKGDKDFLGEFRDQFQMQLPATVLFEYDEADVRGDLLQAQVDQVYVDFVVSLYEAGANNIEGSLINRQQALTLLARKQLIPPEWTEVEEESVATDIEVARMKRLRERLLDTSDEARRALAYQGAILRSGVSRVDRHDIVQYAYPSNKTTVLWRAANWPHYGRSVQTIPVPPKELPGHVVERAVLYEDDDDEELVITDDDVDAAIAAAEERHGEEDAQILE